MSRRLLAGSGLAALALVLAAPTAALAAGSEEHGDSSAKDHGKSGSHAKDHGQRGSQAKDADGHNPPGNNGTIKIDYAAPADSGHANRPHPGCAFQLRMFGFDDDQYGSITFVGQAPTKLGTLLTQPHVLLSDDAAGGGKDVDQVYSYTAQQLGLLGKPQAHQGWHVKVSVDADNAPGGAKHKVFWLKCPEVTTGSAGTTTTPTGSTVTTKSFDTTQVAGTTSGAATTAVKTSGAPAGSVVASATAGQAAAEAAPAVRPASRGSALPFTGLAGLGTMLAIALAAVVAGGLAIRAGRRRTLRY